MIKIRVQVALFSVLIVCAGLRSAAAQSSGIPAGGALAQLTSEQVVDNLVRRNLARAQELAAYCSTRTYRLEYHGFLSSKTAEMVVDVTYKSPATKEFTIRSETGSKLLIERVFKKMLQSEKEALTEENPKGIILNRDNYKFTPAGYESTPMGGRYIFSVEPRTRNKFLYRGRIWVDAQEFAVVRMEGEPGKNPSFWTKDTKIEQTYAKVGAFWFPSLNRSTTSIRLGGRAILTIDYKDYQPTAFRRPNKSNSTVAGVH